MSTSENPTVAAGLPTVTTENPTVAPAPAPASAPVVTAPASSGDLQTAKQPVPIKNPCPHCGTLFVAGKEPWLQQKLHCPRHDMVYPLGSVCSGCEAELGHDAALERAMADAATLADALAKVQRPK
jgi:hypothetical protein